MFVRIEYASGRLSISGVVGPTSNGNAVGGCGQINRSLREDEFSKYAPSWDADKVNRFLDIWERWHLNDMRAGTPKQMQVLWRNKEKFKETEAWKKHGPHAYASFAGFDSFYDLMLHWLAEENLEVDNGYKFGTAWLREDVPEDVLTWLRELPNTDKTPAWV